jgi:glycine cleavage system aminomethyltransferase T
MLPFAMGTPGTEFTIDIRGRHSKARVVPEPFYKRAKT